ncbi:hypothetical protein GURASL_23760 [Geotalea uraniireducens]|uniref:Secreted protein n=1 Tax=Geotalea uraniireducens TaxID=351604 RepID=A0ABM8ELM2_9BACT|nr:hypothetical protein [Geotalea uraniireducens]BDV43453.1 hypothetical protein GURASL_23760 [Geotalea uraniireducens]
MKRSFHGGMKRKVLVGITVALTGLMPVMAQAANKLIVKDSTGTTDKMVVTDTGSIGVNISSPIYKFHLVGTGDPSTCALFVSNPGRATGYLATDSGGFSFMRNNDISVNNGLPRANDRLGYFGFGANIGGSNRWLTMVQAYSETDANASTSSAPTYLSFGTTGATGYSAVERLRITSVGNIGVGTSSPTQKIEVNGGIKLNTATTKPTCDSTVRGTIWFTRSATGVADALEVCAKDATDNYAWKALF